jgi:SAM-dependent methyltransferase
MQLDVEDLRDFYATQLGQIVRRTLSKHIRACWPRANNATILGLGFATPYLGSFKGEAARVCAVMPATQGALVWPQNDKCLTALAEETLLPVPDNSIDRLLVVHGLEAAARERAVLREFWRVLAPDGRLLVIVPNRRGLWARFDTTPFGQGRPYSKGQLERLLRDALFTPVEWSNALHIPPLDRRMVLRTSTAVERVGARVSPVFGGVIIVEATKELVAPAGRKSKVRKIRDMVIVKAPGIAVPTRPRERV